MNVKFTKKRFENHFIYDWIKYIVVSLCIIVAFSFLYASTAKKLLDIEELKVITYCYKYDTARLNTMSEDLLEALSNEVNPELKNVNFMSFSTTLHETDPVKFNVELQEAQADVFILPSVEEYRKKATTQTEDGTEEMWIFNDHYSYSHQYVSGRNTFITIDEMIRVEKESGDMLRAQRATRLENILAGYDPAKLYAKYARFSARGADVDPEYYEFDQNGQPLALNWGINLNVLDTKKLEVYFRGEEKMEFILAVRSTSENLTDCVAYITWLFENFAVQ